MNNETDKLLNDLKIHSDDRDFCWAVPYTDKVSQQILRFTHTPELITFAYGDKFHRYDGPAIIHLYLDDDPQLRFWVDGNEMSYEEHKRRVKLLIYI